MKRRRVGALVPPGKSSHDLGMRSVSLRALKKLAEYIRLAASGATVAVINRGRARAEIVLQARPTPLLSDAFFAKAVRDGWITMPTVVSDEPPPRKPMMPFRDLMDELRHDRES